MPKASQARTPSPQRSRASFNGAHLFNRAGHGKKVSNATLPAGHTFRSSHERCG